ncbi:MAG TPA: histone deacetylase [Solirubrobacterales bacterium]|nr:histone deacetylase [Solirubrobacterales bacterium]
MLYFSHPSSFDHDPRAHLPGHPENPERLRAIEEYLTERDWLGWERREAPAASTEELELVHTPTHVERIRRLCASGGSTIDVDTAVVPSSYKAARHATGGACEMVRALLGGEAEVGFTAARPPGHHAEPERAMGFCLFNSIAIAAELAIRELGAERVFILDWDVHHGNGTEAAFRERADVLFASIHQGGIFPGTGPRSETGTGAGEDFTINLPVPGGSGEEVWLPLLEDPVLPAAREFRPDLILISAGFDAHLADPLAGCTLRTESFAEMASRTRELAVSLGVPVGAVLEGGYEPTALAGSVAATMDALSG